MSRLESLLVSVRALNRDVVQSMSESLTGDLQELAQHETGFQLSLFQFAIPDDVLALHPLVGISPDAVYAAAMARPFQGRLLSEWASSLEADRMTRITNTVRQGFLLTALSLNGVAGGNGFCVDTFNIQFDNNMQTQRCIGTGSAFAGANIPTTFTPSGQVTLSWSKAAWEIYKKTFTGETVPFSFTLENAEGAYIFEFPEVQISGDWPDAGSTDIVQVQLDITAAKTRPTITRVPKVQATAISVAPATSTGVVGSTLTLTATLTPVDATDTVEWTSSDPVVASVVSTGQKTAKLTRNAAGTAVITGKARTFTATSAITVTVA